MKKLVNILMLSCKKSSELIEKRMYFGLNPIEKIQLFLHTSMCDACRGWKKQSKGMDEALRQHVHKHHEQKDLSADVLPDETKQKISEKLEQQQ